MLPRTQSNRNAQIVIDAGNTSTTVALYRTEGAAIEAITPVHGGIAASREACAKAIRKALAAAKTSGAEVKNAIISSVTPGVNGDWETLVREITGRPLRFVRHDIPLPFTLDIPHPETMGADRTADLAATALLYGTPALVIDIGTAVTYDVLSISRSYFTGVIGPGPEIIARSLHDYTALLPLVEWWKKGAPEIPADTEGAMLFGIEAGFCGMVRETVRRLIPLVGPNAKLIATGGFAARFVSQLGMDFIIDPNLTLRGIGLLGDMLSTPDLSE